MDVSLLSLHAYSTVRNDLYGVRRPVKKIESRMIASHYKNVPDN
jgi:hypothetical protein